MTLLIDTSALIALEKGDKQIVSKFKEFVKAHPNMPFISFMTHVEFLIGIEKFSDIKKSKSKEYLNKFPVLHTTNKTSEWLSHLKHIYDKKGRQKSLTDLFIASQAIEHNLTLITRDKDFSDIDEVSKIVL